MPAHAEPRIHHSAPRASRTSSTRQQSLTHRHHRQPTHPLQPPSPPRPRVAPAFAGPCRAVCAVLCAVLCCATNLGAPAAAVALLRRAPQAAEDKTFGLKNKNKSKKVQQ